MKTIRAADLFCGAGGASTGFVRACAALGLDYDLLAVNHWPTAVETHSANHPGVRHLCESIEKVDPREVVPGGRLNLLMAGPECTHFSTARGGRPVNPQSRASAWHILKWAQELYIDTILIENVPEFRTWGPVGVNGKPLKSKKGQTYRAFIEALKSLGYKVEDRILNAADYGDPTTRRRLFIFARRGKHQIAWPTPTHSKTGAATLFGQTKRWKPARDIIDWNLEGKSIFHRKKPLRPATIARILAGLEKFGGPQLQPFLVVLRNHMAGQSIDGPLPTIAASGQHVGVAEPFLMHITHSRDANRTHGVEAPLPTVTGANRGELALVEPFILQQQSGGAPRSTHDPLPTVATDGAIALVEPCLVQTNERRAERVQSVDEPMRTITALGGRCFGLAQPFLVPMYGERPTQEPRTHSVDDPVPTIPATGGGKFGVVEPFIITPGGANLREARGTSQPLPTVTGSDRFAVVEPFIFANRTHNAPKSVDEPVPALCTGDHIAIVEPYLTKFYGTAKTAQSVDEPLDTLTAKDRFALVQPVIDGYVLDIRFRMLQDHELAAATSFPKSYVFCGNREDRVKQIGNSWPGEVSLALNLSALEPYAPARKRSWRDEATA